MTTTTKEINRETVKYIGMKGYILKDFAYVLKSKDNLLNWPEYLKKGHGILRDMNSLVEDMKFH